MPKISVVVAIYNIEIYLEQCLQSIISQTCQDIEIILVDDGSPDDCPAICDEYARRDKRIKVIHQKNQGSVMARYNGALAATGDYLSFIDGDDWLEDTMYEEMAKLAESCNADIVVTGYLLDDAAISYPHRNAIASGVYADETLAKFWEKALFTGTFYEFGVFPALWCKLLRRELYEELRHPHPLIKIGEDAAISYPAMARAKRIIVDNDKKLYHYRLVQNSMSRAFDERYFERARHLLAGLKENLAENALLNRQLIYYALMISRIGIEQVLSRRCSLPLLQKQRMIASYRDEFLRLGWEGQDIDWGLLPVYQRLLLQSFWQGDMKRLLAMNFMHRVCGKGRRLFNGCIHK